MKKTYLSPELEILCFAPCERLASVITWAPKNELMGAGPGGSGLTASTIETPIPDNPEGDM